jgi:hypothetical protein
MVMAMPSFARKLPARRASYFNPKSIHIAKAKALQG